MNSNQRNLVEKLLPYDALVLIHPDMIHQGEINGNPAYFENLELATYNLEAEEKPIFFLQRYPHLKNRRIQQISPLWQLIPSSNPMIDNPSSEDLQTQIDYMSDVIGKDPSKIMIAGGGTALGVCVTDFMHAWCDNVYGPYSLFKKEKQVSRKINEGTIFPELTDVSSLYL